MLLVESLPGTGVKLGLQAYQDFRIAAGDTPALFIQAMAASSASRSKLRENDASTSAVGSGAASEVITTWLQAPQLQLVVGRPVWFQQPQVWPQSELYER